MFLAWSSSLEFVHSFLHFLKIESEPELSARITTNLKELIISHPNNDAMLRITEIKFRGKVFHILIKLVSYVKLINDLLILRKTPSLNLLSLRFCDAHVVFKGFLHFQFFKRPWSWRNHRFPLIINLFSLNRGILDFRIRFISHSDFEFGWSCNLWIDGLL
jgi:hypothetical protein